MSSEKFNTNYYEIDNKKDALSFIEFKSMLESYDLNGVDTEERASKLRAISPEKLAFFMTDLNRRIQESETTNIHEEVMKIGKQETISPEDRFDTFMAIDNKIQNSDPSINPERLGDALALATVMLHPFKDGNGRTSRLIGFIFRDEFDATEGQAQEAFNALSSSRDTIREKGGFVINGYVPYMPEGSSQKSPSDVEDYISQVLSDPSTDARLYTGPYGQASLRQDKQA